MTTKSLNLTHYSKEEYEEEACRISVWKEEKTQMKIQRFESYI